MLRPANPPMAATAVPARSGGADAEVEAGAVELAEVEVVEIEEAEDVEDAEVEEEAAVEEEVVARKKKLKEAED